MNYKDYITIDKDIRFGKPCVKKTRIAVYDVLSWFASGMNMQEILIDFSQLSEKQILACFAYKPQE